MVTSHEESDDPARAGTPATAPPTPGTGGPAEGSTPHAQHPALGLCPSGGRVGLRVRSATRHLLRDRQSLAGLGLFVLQCLNIFS